MKTTLLDKKSVFDFLKSHASSNSGMKNAAIFSGNTFLIDVSNYHSNHKFFAFLILLKKIEAPERRRDKKRSLNFHFITFKLHFLRLSHTLHFEIFQMPWFPLNCNGIHSTFLTQKIPLELYTSIWLNYISYESCSGWATKPHSNDQQPKEKVLTTWPSGLFFGIVGSIKLCHVASTTTK